MEQIWSLALAARVATSEDAHHDVTGTDAQLHLVMRALEEIADLADVGPHFDGLHSVVLSPAARAEPSAFADRPRPPGIMDSMIVMVDYSTFARLATGLPAGRCCTLRCRTAPTSYGTRGQPDGL